jgi:hypothetical protein
MRNSPLIDWHMYQLILKLLQIVVFSVRAEQSSSVQGSQLHSIDVVGQKSITKEMKPSLEELVVIKIINIDDSVLVVRHCLTDILSLSSEGASIDIGKQWRNDSELCIAGNAR